MRLQRWIAPLLLGVTCAGLGVAAAWPIYETLLLWLAAAGALAGAGLTVAVARWRRLGLPASIGILAVVWLLMVVPVTSPQLLGAGPSSVLRGMGAALLGLVQSWKQLLTIELPVGNFESLLVPCFTVLLVAIWCVFTIGIRAKKNAVWAAVPLFVPVMFGTLWGQVAVSDPWQTPFGQIQAPREIALWFAASAVALCWVTWCSHQSRLVWNSAADSSDLSDSRSGMPNRAVWATSIVVVAVGAGIILAPALAQGMRDVPRAALAPETVLQQQPSMLSSYRAWKQDTQIDSPLFSFEADGGMPERLRMAVLDEYDGVTFGVSTDATGAFTRNPWQFATGDTSHITIEIAEGYSGIWVPLANAISTPTFSGERAAKLAESFFINRYSGAGLVAPGGSDSAGLQQGDGYNFSVTNQIAAELGGEPISDDPLYDLALTPELVSWVQMQEQPGTAAGLTELVKRLRERGALSHSLSDDGNATLWAQRLNPENAGTFAPSAGGHSLARIEQLFSELSQQQKAAGADADDQQLVGTAGDDEQFAVAGALLARALGFESRVVVGVRLGGNEGAGSAEIAGVPSCAEVCTGESIAAWVEVQGSSGEWVSLDVTPQTGVVPSMLSAGADLLDFDTVAVQQNAETVDPQVNSGERSETSETTDTPEQVLAWWGSIIRGALIALSFVVLLALPLLFFPFAKAWRTRWRRKQTDPELATLSAWHELIDRGRDCGVTVQRNVTRSEQARAFDTAAVHWVAAEVDRAVWSPEGITPAEAQQIWNVVDAEVAALHQQLGLRERIRAALSPVTYRKPVQHHSNSNNGTGTRLRKGMRRWRRDREA